MKSYLFLFLLILSTQSYGQLYKDHNWEKTPSFYTLNEEEAQLSSVAIKEKYLIQYHKPLIGELALYETKHAIIRIIDDKGIKKHNRVFISLQGISKVIDIKARVLYENGNVINLNKNNIKELKDVEGYGGYKIFAIEGIEKNTQVEYIYTLKKNLSSLGSIIIQKNYQIRESEIIIRKPNSLSIEIKGYNNYSPFIKEKVKGNRTAYLASKREIPAMENESYATPDANKIKVYYLLNSSTSSGNQRWNYFVNNIRNNFIKLKPRKYKKLIKDFEKFDSSESNVILKIHEYITENYNVKKGRSPFEDLKNIVNTKIAGDFSVIKVYGCLLNYYNIDYEVAFTSNRYYHKFDEYFFTTANLGVALLYFPKEGTYLTPSVKNWPIGYPPHRFANNRGVFINASSYNFKTILLPDINYTIMDRSMQVNLNLDEESLTVSGDYKISGYRGHFSRIAYKNLKDENMDRFKQMEAGSGIDDIEFLDFKVNNKDIKMGNTNTPISILYTYKTSELLEDTGNGYLFSVGKLIGTQGELFEEKKRVNPIELSYPNRYIYTIEIKIPDGYIVKNLEGLVSNSTFNVKDTLGGHFTSTYTLTDNILKINLSEKYYKVEMDKSFYPNLKEVVNAAYDFSQKVILLERIN